MKTLPQIQIKIIPIHRKILSGLFILALFAFGLFSFIPVKAAANLSIVPLTWNVVGLDSNNVNVGPNNFPVGIRVCNAGTEATNVQATFVWDDGLDPYSGNAYINLRTGSLESISLSTLAGADTCYDFYFEVSVNRNANAYDKSRRYHIDVTADGGIALSTSRPREIFVEHLISQNRNSVSDVKLDGVSVPVGGSMALMVGNSYDIAVIGSTATQGYEQIESFLSLPNTIFQVNSVTTSYSAHPTPDTDGLWSTKLYADGCHWMNDPDSPNYRSCLSTGKYGGAVTVTYNVTIISGAGSSQNLSTLIYDFSGSSFHYNADYSVSGRTASIIGSASITIAKRFVPDAATPGGTSTLMFTLSNPTIVPISGVNFSDTFPASPGAMVVAPTPNVSYSGCGSGAFSPTLSGGEASVSFSNGAIAPNSSCIIKVDVIAPVAGTYNNSTDHLYINTDEDTGNTASASLTASQAQSCLPDVTMANWTIPNGTVANPPDLAGGLPTVKAANVSTASLAAHVPASAQLVTNSGWTDLTSWGTFGYKNAGQYVDFVIDTRHYSGVSMTFYVKNDGTSVGPTSLVVSYDSGSGFNNILTISNPAVTFTPHTLDLTGLTSTSGNTTIRITGSGANNDNQGAGVAYDAITFTGCSQASPPPTLSKAFSTSPIPVNTTSRLTFTLQNAQAGNEALTGVQFSDGLPDGLEVATPPNANTTGAGCTGVTFSPAPSDTTLNYSVANMAAGASCTAYVDVVATQPGQFDNVSGYISSSESGQNKTSNGYGSATLTAIAPPILTKAFSASPILTGDTTALTFSVQNPNQEASLSGISFTDSLPTGMSIASPANLNSDCTGTITGDEGTQDISLNGASLAGSASCSISLDVIGVSAGTLNNLTSAITSTEGGAGNTATATLVVKDPLQNINMLKQVSLTGSDPWTNFVAVDPPLPQDVYFRFIVENTGDTALSNVNVNDVTLPGMTTDCATVLSSGLALYETKICTSDPVSVSISGAYLNEAYATGDAATSPHSSANYATTDLTLAKSVAEGHYSDVGDVLHYSFLITNTGYAPLMGPVVVLDDMASDEACPAVDTVGDFDNFLDPGEVITCTATYTVQNSDISGLSVTNIASATIDGVSSNTDTQTVTLADMDYGDLPAAYHDTLLSESGARHTIGSLYLGAAVSSELDGQESSSASTDTGDDGVALTGNWSDGAGDLNVTVTGGRGCLMGWMDYWNGASPYTSDNDFGDAGETILDNLPVDPGVNPLSFSLPAGAANNAHWFARFRLVPDQDNDGDCSDQSAIGLTGLAQNGEVEDYYWSFSPTSVQLVALSAKPESQALPLALLLVAGLVGFLSLVVLPYRFRADKA